MKQFRPSQFAAFVLIVAAYVVIRLWGITASCLAFDEIFSVHAAEHDWSSLWSFVALDLIHPPLFYFLLKIWILIGGEGLFWLRLLPVIFAIVAIFPFVSLCRELKTGSWTRLLALLFIAVNGSLIKYSHEVRMYSLLMCMSLFSLWLFARYFVKGKSLVPLIIVNVLLVWTHYFGWFEVIAEVGTIVLFQRIKWRPALIMLGVTCVSIIPWIFAVIMSADQGTGLTQNIGWMTRPSLSAIAQFKLNLIEPFYFTMSNMDPLSVYRVTIPLLVIITVSVVIYALHWEAYEPEEKRSFGLLFLFVIFPTLAAFILSWQLPYSIWGTRHLIPVFPPVAILLAVFLTRMPTPKLRLALLTLVFLFIGYGFVLQAARPATQYIWCAWDGLASELPPAKETNIYALEDDIAYHLWFAERNDPTVKVYKLEAGAPEDPAYFLPRGFHEVERVSIENIDQNEFWLAFRTSEDSYALNPIAGYVESERLEIKMQNTKALLVKVRRQSDK